MTFKPLPKGPFQIVYADPPWSYGNVIHSPEGSVNSAAKLHYPTLSKEEICALPVKQIVAPDSLLFLWATGPMLADAIEVGNAWGFAYKTVAFVWNKERVAPGHYTMAQTEFCLVFKRGKIPQPRGTRNERQHLAEKPAEHSRKPAEIRRRIERMFPDFLMAKIELFASGPVPGWSVWGLQSGGEKVKVTNLEDILGGSRDDPKYGIVK